MASTVAYKFDEYLRYADECWKFCEDADDIETKAVFELTAEAWTRLAAQVEMLKQVKAPEVLTQPVHLEPIT